MEAVVKVGDRSAFFVQSRLFLCQNITGCHFCLSPFRRKAPRITIKKAYLYGGLGKNELFNWIAEADKGTVTPKDVSITVGSYGNVTPDKYESGAQRNFANQNAWVLRNCTPTKWSIGALDGNSNSLILESLELVAEEISVGK